MQEYWPYILTAVIAVVGWLLFILQFIVNRRLKESEITITVLENYKNSLYKQLDRNPDPQEEQELKEKLEGVIAAEKRYHMKMLERIGIAEEMDTGE